MTSLERSLRVLEYDKIISMLIDCCPTAGSKELASILMPSYDVDEIKLRQSRTTSAKDLINRKTMPPFGNVIDVRDSTSRASKSACLSTRELIDIGTLLRVTRGLIDYSNNIESSNALYQIFGRLIAVKALEDRIAKVIISEDVIADNASPALSDIRRKIKNTTNKIQDYLSKFMSVNSDSKYLQDNIVTTRNGRYVVPVKAEFKNEIKGLVHDTSSSGATLFIEPMPVVEANNELKSLENDEKREIERILFDLSASVSNYENAINLNYLNITDLALYFGCGLLSIKLNGNEPIIVNYRSVSLINARHPLIDKNKVVPISINIGESYNMLIITGPNTGGKTVTLKTLGLLSLMAQAGLHISASSDSHLCVFDFVYADIGDEQSIEQSLSTFSSHMSFIVRILKDFTENSLVLFDELGAGTDPIEGAALAMAILDSVKNKGALCAATTHYAELKTYALETENVSNASCEFDVLTLKPTYRLIIGTPGKSNAFAISSKLGLAKEIIDKADQYIDKDVRDFEKVIGEIDKTRTELEKEKQKEIQSSKEFESFKIKSEKEINKKLSQANREANDIIAKAKQLLISARTTSDYVLDELNELKKQKDSANFDTKLAETRRNIKNRIREIDDLVDPISSFNNEDDFLPERPLVVGDSVKHMNLGTVATVTELPDKNGNVTLLMGSIKMRANITDLRLVNVKNKQKEKSSMINKAQISKSFKPELDLRGMNSEEAMFMVDKFIDDAIYVNIKSISIIHGKGTGVLRTSIWNYLKKDKRVASYRAGAYGEGDYGITVITLK